MKRLFLLLFLIATSMGSGYLMSRSSWIGKVGMTFFHKGYNLTKIWWQGAIAVFILQLVFFVLHVFINRRMHSVAAKAIHFLLFAAAAAGLFFTYDDFHHDLSHRLLGRHFHSGFYLIWIGWIVTSVFFLFSKKKSRNNTKVQDRMETKGSQNLQNNIAPQT